MTRSPQSPGESPELSASEKPTCSFIVSTEEMAAQAHGNSRNKGFWGVLDKIRALEDKEFAAQLETLWKLSRIALMHSELSEALEGIRKDLPDDHLPHRSMEAAEMADTMIRILDYAGGHGIPLAEVVMEKMAYNSKRPHLHGDKKA